MKTNTDDQNDTLLADDIQKDLAAERVRDAAPELLHACKVAYALLLTVERDHGTDLAVISRAIAKAEGTIEI